MGKYSRVRRYGKRRFRYNYENHTLEWIGEGNVVIDSIGLSNAHWEESRKAGLRNTPVRLTRRFVG